MKITTKKNKKQKQIKKIKPKGINRITKICSGHLCLREEILCCNNNYII
jgi:hypothetical protein